eukprot:scaffold7837_cov1250-Prasinococcus_capsulatus_cf.AAC.1
MVALLVPHALPPGGETLREPIGRESDAAAGIRKCVSEVLSAVDQLLQVEAQACKEEHTEESLGELRRRVREFKETLKASSLQIETPKLLNLSYLDRDIRNFGCIRQWDTGAREGAASSPYCTLRLTVRHTGLMCLRYAG